MISSEKFLIEKIKQLISVYTDTKLSLAFDKLTETFYIKVCPAKNYLNSSDLQDLSADLLDEFLDLYPDDSMVFITEHSLVKFSEFDSEYAGVDYKEKVVKKPFFLDNFLNFELDIKKNETVFTTDNTYALAA